MLRRLGGCAPGACALEISCGSGYRTKLIVDQFGAATVDAIDLDPSMVTRARRLRRYHDQVRVTQGSADDVHSALGGVVTNSLSRAAALNNPAASVRSAARTARPDLFANLDHHGDRGSSTGHSDWLGIISSYDDDERDQSGNRRT